jgi:hypothetical protein
MDPRPPSILGEGSKRVHPRATGAVVQIRGDDLIVEVHGDDAIDSTLDESMQILDETVRHLYGHQIPTIIEWCAIAAQLAVVATTLTALVSDHAAVLPNLPT